ncbi:hypothetical protein EDF68_1432 [Ochrobactrum sp. BH3]|nr:hypothetical protein CWE02_06375 [Brucella pituitosa]TCQ70119.1 hypothetical protein EDF68_1432 [Ochrobactrum sp. BH3]
MEAWHWQDRNEALTVMKRRDMDLYHPSSVHIDKIWWVQEAFISFGSRTQQYERKTQCKPM